MEQEMHYIYTVYEYGSFSKAASALFMTQPALSIAVQRVESRMGMPLFDRTCKPLKLTEAGELYIQKYRQILDLENELEQQMSDLSSLRKGTLRIGGSHYFNSYILPPVLTEFARKYPGIHLELVEAGSNELLDMLYEHKIDLTFNCALKPRDSFHRIPCFTDYVLLAVPSAFPVSKRLAPKALSAEDVIHRRHHESDCPVITMEPFSDTPFILLTPGNNLFDRSTSLFESAQLHPEIRLQVTQQVTAWHLTQAGLGATFISDMLVKKAEENTVFFKIDSPLARRCFDLTMSDRHYISNAMKAFAATFKEKYQKPDD